LCRRLRSAEHALTLWAMLAVQFPYRGARHCGPAVYPTSTLLPALLVSITTLVFLSACHPGMDFTWTVASLDLVGRVLDSPALLRDCAGFSMPRSLDSLRPGQQVRDCFRAGCPFTVLDDVIRPTCLRFFGLKSHVCRLQGLGLLGMASTVGLVFRDAAPSAHGSCEAAAAVSAAGCDCFPELRDLVAGLAVVSFPAWLCWSLAFVCSPRASAACCWRTPDFRPSPSCRSSTRRVSGLQPISTPDHHPIQTAGQLVLTHRYPPGGVPESIRLRPSHRGD